MDFFYALLVRFLVLSVPFSIVSEYSNNGTTPSFHDLHQVIGIYSWDAAFVLAAGGPVIRRLHDLNLSGVHSGWLCFGLVIGQALHDRLSFLDSTAGTFSFRYPASLLDLVLELLAMAPQFLALMLMVWPGTKGPNRYGLPPA